MLALPVGMVVWSLFPKAPIPSGPAPEVGGMREALESMARKTLDPAMDFPTGATIVVAHPRKASGLLAKLATELGGSSLSADPERLVIAVPAHQRGEFLRRAELISGSEIKAGFTDAGILAIDLKSPAAQ